jgi:hypothetical protein
MDEGISEQSIVPPSIDIALRQPEMVFEKATLELGHDGDDFGQLARDGVFGPAETDVGACAEDDEAEDEAGVVAARRRGVLASFYVVGKGLRVSGWDWISSAAYSVTWGEGRAVEEATGKSILEKRLG